MKHNQKGFSAVIILVVIVVVAAVGFAGYYVVNKNKKDDKSSNTSQTTGSSQEATPGNSNTTVNGSYQIKEWGIKIALRDADKVQFDIKALSGQLTTGFNYEAEANPDFKSGAVQDKNCKPGVSLYRSKTKSPGISDDAQKLIDGYYYYITGAPGACSDNPQTNPDDQLKTRILQDMRLENVTKM